MNPTTLPRTPSRPRADRGKPGAPGPDFRLAAALIEHHAGIPNTQITELRVVQVVDFYPGEKP